MDKYFFAIDLGATSGRTILCDGNNNACEIEEINRFPNHLIEIGGKFYWDIYELYRNILDGMKKLALRGIQPTAIGIDTWGVDFVPVGKDGGILRQPRAYRDPYTVGAPEKFFKRIPAEKVYAKTGIQVMNFNTLFQFDAMRREADSAYLAADKILFVPDALAYLLTDEMVTEYTIATTGQIIDADTRKLDAELLEAVGLDTDKFGRLIYPGQIIGQLSPAVQRITGLGAVPVVAVGEHDTASAVAGIPAEDDNYAYLSSGTWSLMGILTRKPVINEKTESYNFTNEGGIDGTIRVLKNICGMWLLERCRAEWGQTDYGELIFEAMKETNFRSVIFPDAPEFANPDDMVKAITDYCARTGQQIPENRGQIVRCIFKSLALRYRQVLEMLRELTDTPIDVLHVIGGGSRNELLCQWTADSCDIPVVAGPTEATAIGNIKVQAKATLEGAECADFLNELNASINLKRYEPQHSAEWEADYDRYLEIVNK